MPLHNINPICKNKERAWKEIDLNALKNNLDVLSSVMQNGCKIMAIVKANAYGHDIYEVSKALQSFGVDAYAVATIDEGIEIRANGITGMILVLGYTYPSRVPELAKYSLTQCVYDEDYASELNNQGIEIPVHIAIDTGMHRLGIKFDEINSIKSIYSLNNLKIEGIFSHLCVSDSLSDDDITYTRKQISNFNYTVSMIENSGLEVKLKHIQSSYGLLNYSDEKYDYARTGIALYGVDATKERNRKIDASLIPVLSLKSKVIQLRHLPCGEPVSYGRTYVTQRDSVIAVLPIGYADGYPRSLSCENGRVLIRGQYAPIVGRICMDQMMVDVTDIKGVSVGDTATLIGKDGLGVITVEEVADKAGTITYEILSRLGSRLTVVVK